MHHFFDEPGKVHRGLPPQYLASFAVISDKEIHFCWTIDSLVLTNIVSVIQSHLAERQLAELAHAMGFACSYYEIIGFRLLEH